MMGDGRTTERDDYRPVRKYNHILDSTLRYKRSLNIRTDWCMEATVSKNLGRHCRNLQQARQGLVGTYEKNVMCLASYGGSYGTVYEAHSDCA